MDFYFAEKQAFTVPDESKRHFVCKHCKSTQNELSKLLCFLFLFLIKPRKTIDTPEKILYNKRNHPILRKDEKP